MSRGRFTFIIALCVATLAGVAIYASLNRDLYTQSASDNFAIVAENLRIPWEIVFLPDGDMLVTERPGTLKRIGKNSRVYEILGVKHTGEGGLLGMALHPDFAYTHWIYLYLTSSQNNATINRVERYRFENDNLFDRTENSVDYARLFWGLTDFFTLLHQTQMAAANRAGLMI